jgi:hypothetical protein
MAALGITRSPQATAAAGGAAGGAVGTGGRSKQSKSGAVGKFITPVSVTIPDRNE